jgi:hypothetical protein
MQILLLSIVAFVSTTCCQGLRQATGVTRKNNLHLSSSPSATAAFLGSSTNPFQCQHDGNWGVPDQGRKKCSHLAMGLLDSISSFLSDREGDFVKMEDTENDYGPGPILLLYNVPDGIDMEEIQEMISDVAPIAHQKDCRVYRLTGDDSELLDLSLEKSLARILRSRSSAQSQMVTAAATLTEGVPVLLFSGFRNDEMMATYDILGQEIYQETSGRAMPACAKAVPNAMSKPLRQVLEEISGDHQDATRSR